MLKHIDSYYWQSHPCEDWAETFSYVIENWSKVSPRQYFIDDKIEFIVGIIKNIHLYKKRNIKKSPVDQIRFDCRTIDNYISEHLEQLDIIDLSKRIGLSGSVIVDIHKLKILKKSSRFPWVLDSLGQVIYYRKNCLGQETRLSKRHWEGLLQSNMKTPRELRLNKVFM